MSQYNEGLARVNGTTVELSQGAVTSENNVIPGALWRFQGDTPGFYFVASITDDQHFELTAPYAGSFPVDVDRPYLVNKDFTPTLKLALMEAGDVDIREIFSYDMLVLDAFLGGGSQVPSEFAQGTRMIFDQEVPPTGWSRELDPTIDDRVLRSVTGTRADGGSWNLSGVSMGAHTHSLTLDIGFQGQNDPNIASPGVSTSQTGAASASLASDSSWRPAHRDVIIACKD